MKVLLMGRPGLYDALGGDRIQIEQTAKELKKLGVEVTLSTKNTENVSQYDIVHVFQLDWNIDAYFQIKNAKKYNKPVVFSPIHHNLNEVKRFDEEYVFDFRRISKILFKNQFNRDLFKEFYRALFRPSRFYAVFAGLFYGLFNLYKKCLLMSDIILVQTKLEAEDLIKTFGVDIKWKIVQNGVGDVFTKSNYSAKSPVTYEDYLICVGRIEPRKNQLSIIAAVKLLRAELGKDLRLVFIGGVTQTKHFEYVYKFKKELTANSWINHFDKIAYADMPSYYHFAKVGISASWFETTGLTSLEAAFCGANAVASGNRAKEYLGDYAVYCDPGDINSIKNAIKIAYDSPRPQLPEHMKINFTWAKAAAATLSVYNELLA